MAIQLFLRLTAHLGRVYHRGIPKNNSPGGY